jgi:hypothetical protein
MTTKNQKMLIIDTKFIFNKKLYLKIEQIMKKLFFIFLLMLSMNIFAAYVDGNELYRRMNSSSMVDIGNGMGYVVGVVDSKFTHCNWSNIRVQQLNDSVKLYLANNPNQRQLSGAVIVENVIKKDYCQ